jgi:hypothetical protein
MLSVAERRRSRRRQGAIRARDTRAAELQEKPTDESEQKVAFRDGRSVGFDEDGGFLASIAASGAIKHVIHSVVVRQLGQATHQ